MRLGLPDGRYAFLRERLPYQDGRAVRMALVAVDQDRAAVADLDLALVRAYVVEWNVIDLDGADVALSTPELAPDDVIEAIAVAAFGLWKARRDVSKPTGAPSPSTRRARRSARSTRT